jgi:hypothetical protein
VVQEKGLQLDLYYDPIDSQSGWSCEDCESWIQMPLCIFRWAKVAGRWHRLAGEVQLSKAGKVGARHEWTISTLSQHVFDLASRT